MTSTSSWRHRRRRVAVIAAGTVAVGTLAAVGPTPLVGAAPAAATGTLATTTTARSTTTGVVSRTGAATVVPFRFGTVGYSRWWARTLMTTRYHWSSTAQYSCLVSLWNSESHWNYRAHNGRSGAHGIPQANPGSKMRGAGRDWRTNPVTQIVWGLGYIEHRYGSPCMALTHYEWHRWY